MLRSAFGRLKSWWNEFWFVGWAEQEDDEQADVDPESLRPGRIII